MNKRLSPQREPINKQEKTMKRKNKTNTTNPQKWWARKKELRPQKGWADKQELMSQKWLVLQTKGLKKTSTSPRYVGM